MSRITRRILPLLVLAALAFASPAQAEAAPIPLDDYWRMVEETRTLATGLVDIDPEEAADDLAAAADRWQAVTAVSLADGTVIAIDHSFLVAQMRADPPDLERLEHLLDALLDTRDAWSAESTIPADLDGLAGILARPEFQWQEPEPSPLEEWWQRVQEWLWELLGRLFSGSEGLGPLASLTQYALMIIGGLILLAILIYVIRGLLASVIAEKELDPDGELDDEHITAAGALKRAQDLSSEGDYRSAVRYLYLSSLLLLEERGLLRYDRSLTNREYLRSVAHLPQLARPFRAVVDVFDRVWYGYQPLDEGAYDQYAAQVTELREQK